MNKPRRDLGALRKSELICGLIYLPIFLFGAQYAAIWIAELAGVDLEQAGALGTVSLIYDALNAVVLTAIFLRYLIDQLRPLQDRGWALFPDLILGWLTQYGLSFLASLVISLLLASLQLEYYNLNQEGVEAIIALSPAIAIVTACVLAPLAEELLFRGLIFRGLYRRSRVRAYAVSMLAFALAHTLGAILHQPVGLTLANLIVYLPAGFALAWIYERSGTIWESIFLHAAINAVAMLLLNLQK